MGAYDDLFDEPASAPARPARPYADLFEDNPKPNLYLGVQANPDEAAERQRLAKRYNVPPEIIDETFKSRAKLDDADAAVQRAPALRSWIAADGARAKVAHDDVENLSAIEAAMSIGRRYGGAAVEGVVGQTAGSTLSGVAGLYGIAARGLQSGIEAVTPRAVGEFLDTPIPEWLNPVNLFVGRPGQVLKDVGRAAGPAPEERTFGTDVTTGVAQMAGQIAAALLTGGTASAGMLFAQGADQMADKTAEDQATQAEKDVATVLGAAWTGITEKYGLDKLLNRVPPALKHAALRKIADVAAGAGIEAAQEVAEGLGQDIIRVLTTNAQAPIGQGVLDEASVAGTVGGIVRAALGVRARGGRAEQATREAEALAEVSKLAEASKVRERSPDDFASFMQALADEGPVPQDLFVDARELDESTLRKLVEASPAAARQAAESLASGTDMQIPVAEFGTSVAGQPFAAAVIPHLKTDPNGMSKAQADALDADEGRASVVDALGRAEQQDAFERSRSVLEARFLEQLNATGRFTPEVNRVKATLTALHYAQIGSRLGITPEQAFEQLPVTIGTDVTAGALEQPAYHGSPHRGIEQFTTQKIGTGEGAQAYGWGLYFAQSKDIAEFYRRTLTGTTPQQHERRAAEARILRKTADKAEQAGDTERAATLRAKAAELEKESGQLYEVEVPDDADLLDYDVSLKDQPEKVRKALEGLGIAAEGVGVFMSGSAQPSIVFSGSDALAKARKYIKDRNLNAAPRSTAFDMSGGAAYEQLSKKLGGPEAASRALFAAGIPGLRYLDAGSRGAQADKTTRNYVIFDDSAVKKTGELYQRDAAAARGQYSPDTKTIALLKDANLSTFIHESGHLYLDHLSQLAVRDDAPTSFREDMQTLLDWFGVTGGPEAWNAMSVDQQREHHERFARGFEAYALEGKAPSSALAGAFQRFRGWLRRLYRSIRSLDVELTDEVRAVMDRMVATDEEIQQARAAQSMGLMFSEADAKKLGVDYRAYQAIDEQATDDAATELDARRLKDLKWFDNAKSAALRALQRQARDLRVAVEAEVTAEVDATPTERARRALDELSAADPATVERLKEWQERRDAEAERARAKVKAEILGQNPDLTGLERAQLINASKAEITSAVERDLRAWDRANPQPRPVMTPLDFDSVADTAGFASGDEMLRALAESPRRSDLIRAMTDQRMLEQYGDITSREELEQAAIEAVYSKARARVVATELGALEKAAAVTTRTVTKAAQAFAAQVVGRQQVGKLRPEKFEAAARKAAAASLKAFRAGDIAKAAAEKRNELINTYAAREARERKAEIDKKVAQYKRSANKPIKDVAKTRDADLVQAMRAVLAEYGIGAKGEAAQKYLDALKGHDPATAAQLADTVTVLTANAQDYRQVTVDEFRALADDIDMMWALSRRNRQMVIDGDLIDAQEAAAALKTQIDAQGVPARIPGEGYAVTEGEKVTALLRSARAGLRRVESWVNARDGGALGPFRKYVWNPVKEAADRYRADQLKYLKRYQFLLSRLDLGKARIDAPELGYVFGYSKGGSGKQEILHAILHTGNASNKRKLLLGRGWGELRADGTLDSSKWDAFVKRMTDAGVLTKADYDFAQGVWDMLEDTKAGAQKTHREVFGRSFDEVTAEAFTTPWGEYRGGYVPALADPDAVSDAKTRGIVEEENQTMMHAFPSTPKGFTKGRVEYNRPLLLDLRSLSSHVDKVLMFTHLEQPVRGVRRVLGDDAVRKPLSRVDSAAYDGMLIPWLSRAARQQVETPVPGYNGLFRYFTKLRSRAGMAAMFANVLNTAQQITGFSLAALRVRPRHLTRALVQYVTNPRQTAERVSEASTYMANRMANEVSLMNQAIDDILLNPNVYQKAQAWTARHAYFMQAAVDNVMSPIIWTGAYNQAIEQGASEADARRQADSAVRETQGSNLPEDVANFEAGTPFVRLFTQFQGYFNMQANLLGTEFAKTQRELGLRAGMGRGLYIFTLGFLAPALVSQLIVEAGRGGPEDEDGDGYLDDWLAALGLGVAKSSWALIPVVGPLANVTLTSWNNKPYDDKISTAPAVSMLEGAAHAPHSVYDAVAGEGSARKAVKDVASLISITTGLPAYALARPAGYAADVLQGRVAPTGPVDAVRGTVTGTPSAASKQ